MARPMVASPPPALERPGATVRFPLQTGVSAVWNATRAVLLLVASPFFVLLPSLASPDGVLLSVLLAPMGLGLVAYGVISLVRALRQRTSDFVLTSTGITIEGGPRHGIVVPWEELTVEEVDAEQHVEKRTTLLGILLTSLLFWLVIVVALWTRELGFLGGFDFVRLKVQVTRFGVMRDDGTVVWVAETDEGVEAESLRAARDSIRAVIRGRGDAAGEAAPVVAASVLVCPGCGAPVPPADAASVQCQFCEALVPISNEVRAQTLAHQTVAAQRADLAPFLATILEQPRPPARNQRLLGSALGMVGCWLVGWALVFARVSPVFLQGTDLALLAAPLVGVLALAFHQRASLSERQAIQMVSLRFGALAPARRGEPARCRRCHGALPSAGANGLVTCLYCEADNVLGLDLRPAVDAARAEEASLVATATRARAERVKWRWLAALAAVLSVVWLGTAVVTLVKGVRRQAPRTSTTEFT